MAVTPITWFLEKASAMILLCIKHAFTEEKSEQRGRNNMAVGGAGKVKRAEMPKVQREGVQSTPKSPYLPSN